MSSVALLAGACHATADEWATFVARSQMGGSPTRWITRDRANIAKHAKNSEALRNKMPYWFDVLEDSLGLKEDAAGPRPTEDGERRKLDQEANHA